MIKSKLALILDSIFISLLSSFLIYLWLLKLVKSAIIVKFVAISTLVLLFIILFNLFIKNNNGKILKDKNSKFLTSCINQLILLDKQSYVNFICKLIGCKHLENFTFKLNENYLYINLKNDLSSDDYFNLQDSLHKYPSQTFKLYFIYRSKTKSFDDMINISNLDIVLLDYKIILKIMTLKNIYPINQIEPMKPPFKKRLISKLKSKTSGITQKHFKELFFSGLSLLFLSLIVPFSKYYLIMGTILLVISIITLFKKNYNKNESDTDFLLK